MSNIYQLSPRGDIRIGVVSGGVSAKVLDTFIAGARRAEASTSTTFNSDLTGFAAEYTRRKSLSFYPYTLPDCGLLLRAIVESAKEQAPTLWENAFPEEFNPGTAQGLKYVVGGSFIAHADDRVHAVIGESGGEPVRRWVVNAPSRQLVGIFYLNDDYEGGELYFEHIKNPDGTRLSIKPKKGQIVVFGGDDRYLHGVTEITKGERYALTLWFAPLPVRPVETVAEHKRLFALEAKALTPSL